MRDMKFSHEKPGEEMAGEIHLASDEKIILKEKGCVVTNRRFMIDSSYYEKPSIAAEKAPLISLDESNYLKRGNIFNDDRTWRTYLINKLSSVKVETNIVQEGTPQSILGVIIAWVFLPITILWAIFRMAVGDHHYHTAYFAIDAIYDGKKNRLIASKVRYRDEWHARNKREQDEVEMTQSIRKFEQQRIDRIYKAISEAIASS